MSARTPVLKTLKLYVNGAFIRSESGQTMRHQTLQGAPMYLAKASRKDLRNTILAARKAQPGWAGRTAYNRGQILYRLAEIMEDRKDGFAADPDDVLQAIDRAVHYAGWSDKIEAMLSTLNPVANTYVNYSKIRPLGLVAAVPDPADGLLGLVDAIGACTVMGNAAILFVDAHNAERAITLAECLATCDMPSGVVNILTGEPKSLIEHAGRQDDLDGLRVASTTLDDLQRVAIDTAAAQVMRRIIHTSSTAQPCEPIELAKLAEVQTVWMSAYEPNATQGSY